MKRISLQISLPILCFVFFLVAILLGFGYNILNTAYQETIKTQEGTASLYFENLTKTVKQGEDLMKILFSQSAFNRLQFPMEEAAVEIAFEEMEDYAFPYIKGSGDCLYVGLYSKKNNIASYWVSRMVYYEEGHNLLEFIKSEEPQYPKWTAVKIQGYSYLVRCFSSHGCYIALFINLDSFSRQYAPENEILFYNTDGVLFAEEQTGKISEMKTFLENGNQPEGSHVLTGKIDQTNVTMAVFFPYQGFLAGLGQGSMLLLGLSLLLVVYMVWYYKRLRSYIVHPLEHLRKTFIRTTEEGLDIEDSYTYKSQELIELSREFTNMCQELKKLKIEKYEWQLREEKIKLQYYQLQIKPHFFINWLKVIFGMAQTKKYEKIQDVTIALSNYFRGVFRDGTKLVELREEKEFLENFISLQRIGEKNNFHCEISMEEDTLKGLVPMLLTETFVENSLRHAIVKEGPLLISVEASRIEMEDGFYLDICIRDNGQGYPEEIRERLNHLDVYEETGKEHVGIENLFSRILLIYGEQATFFIDNQGGAMAEIILPFREKTISVNESEI